jgi:hypothetical protein
VLIWIVLTFVLFKVLFIYIEFFVPEWPSYSKKARFWIWGKSSFIWLTHLLESNIKIWGCFWFVWTEFALYYLINLHLIQVVLGNYPTIVLLLMIFYFLWPFFTVLMFSVFCNIIKKNSKKQTKSIYLNWDSLNKKINLFFEFIFDNLDRLSDINNSLAIGISLWFWWTNLMYYETIKFIIIGILRLNWETIFLDVNEIFFTLENFNYTLLFFLNILYLLIYFFFTRGQTTNFKYNFLSITYFLAFSLTFLTNLGTYPIIISCCLFGMIHLLLYYEVFFPKYSLWILIEVVILFIRVTKLKKLIKIFRKIKLSKEDKFWFALIFVLILFYLCIKMLS